MQQCLTGGHHQPLRSTDSTAVDGVDAASPDESALVAACVSVSVPDHECFRTLWASFFLTHGSAAALLRHVKVSERMLRHVELHMV